MAGLETYRAKRNFGVTAEPRGRDIGLGTHRDEVGFGNDFGQRAYLPGPLAGRLTANLAGWRRIGRERGRRRLQT